MTITVRLICIAGALGFAATLQAAEPQQPQQPRNLAATADAPAEEVTQPGTNAERPKQDTAAEISEPGLLDVDDPAGEPQPAEEPAETSELEAEVAEDAADPGDAEAAEGPSEPGDLEEPEELAETEPIGEDAEAFMDVEELDLIPLPEDIARDAEFLDITEPVFDSSLDLPADLPPMEVAPALPSVPVGESERVISQRYRELRIKVDKNPELLSLREQADEASTYEQSRAAMREYYRKLFSIMREEDPTLIPRIDAMERAYLNRLAQTRIEPTIPLEPPPTPEPLE